MGENGGDRAAWMREWDEGERRGKGWMDGGERGAAGCMPESDEGERRGRVWMDAGVGGGREEGEWLDRCGSRMRESGGGGAGWMGEWDEGKRRGRGWMDGEVG